MREDLDAYGNELNYYVVACKYSKAIFVLVLYGIPDRSDNTAYVIGQIPLMTLQTKARMYVAASRQPQPWADFAVLRFYYQACKSFGRLLLSANPRFSTLGIFIFFAPSLAFSRRLHLAEPISFWDHGSRMKSSSSGPECGSWETPLGPCSRGIFKQQLIIT